MSAKSSSPSFVVSLPLRVSRKDEREIDVRFCLFNSLYNATLGEFLRRLDQMRNTPEWIAARALPKLSLERPALFKAARERVQFSEYAAHAFVAETKNAAKWNEGRKHADPRVSANEAQKIATRAFEAVERHALGQGGRPRFKGRGRGLQSIEGKSNKQGIRWNSSAGMLVWGSLTLPAVLPPDGRDPYLAEALQCPVKYARLVRKIVKGRMRHFAQLILKGTPPVKYLSGEGKIVGLDAGPSAIGLFSDEFAGVVQLAPGVVQPWKETRRLQRKMDRSRRATNPECYHEDGTWKKGSRVQVRSRHFEKTRSKLRETERVLAARRAREHGEVINKILALGAQVHAENLSYRAWQKRFGRSSKVRAVGMFMEKLHRKAERAGGGVVDLNARSLRMSQLDPLTGVYRKKELSERWHVLGDGSGVVQRDVLSAFLARCATRVDGQDAIHSSQIDTIWPAANLLLRRAGWMREQPASVASVEATAPKIPAPERVARRRPLACSGSPENGSGKPARDGVRTLALEGEE